MALFKVKTSNKIETNMRIEESTAKMLDRYAHFHKANADDVVNEALEYIFQHDKDFQQDLVAKPDEKVTATVRVQVPAEPAPPKAPRVRDRTAASTPSSTAK